MKTPSAAPGEVILAAARDGIAVTTDCAIVVQHPEFEDCVVITDNAEFWAICTDTAIDLATAERMVALCKGRFES